MEFPAWYQSSSGPELSRTISGIIGSFLPVINLVLASKGINLLPEEVNMYISIAVFVGTSIWTAIGYVRAKNALGNRIADLEDRVVAMGGRI